MDKNKLRTYTFLPSFLPFSFNTTTKYCESQIKPKQKQGRRVKEFAKLKGKRKKEENELSSEKL